MNQTYELPPNLGDLMGAYDEAHWETVVAELKPDVGVLTRGTVLSSGSGADAGKLISTTAGNEAQAFGVLLDANVDTAQHFGDGSVTGSIARAGSFRGRALIVGVGTNAATLTTQLRLLGIFVEGVIVAPVAATLETEAPAPAEEPAATA
jgi:hypothetical protein